MLDRQDSDLQSDLSGGYAMPSRIRGLSGKLLWLTIAFVMLAEVLIFVPSIARFRADFLTMRLEKAQIAALAQLAAEDMVTPALEKELLANAEVYNVVLRRDEVRQLVLSSPLPAPISATYDLRDAGPWELIRDALVCLFDPKDDIIRVIGTNTSFTGPAILAKSRFDAEYLDGQWDNGADGTMFKYERVYIQTQTSPSGPGSVQSISAFHHSPGASDR